jgi:hypothetical protein
MGGKMASFTLDMVILRSLLGIQELRSAGGYMHIEEVKLPSFLGKEVGAGNTLYLYMGGI